MNTYTPDKWVLLEFSTPEYGRVHKVLAGWYGGFAGSNSWKLSSGTTEAIQDSTGTWYLKQSSGSTYVLYPEYKGYTSLTNAIYHQIKESFPEVRVVGLDIL